MPLLTLDQVYTWQEVTAAAQYRGVEYVTQAYTEDDDEWLIAWAALSMLGGKSETR